MDNHREIFRLEPMCWVLKVSRSSYYYWREHRQRACSDEQLVKDIRRIHEQSRKTYGSPRITHELRKRGNHYNRKRIARLMRENGTTLQGDDPDNENAPIYRGGRESCRAEVCC